ncbi:MAG: lamin tail domain-containing protein [Flavobacteriales bacterium]|nr:lamin tail domain-containing protein [Flavobacteriales bacterium]MBL6872513.1 lamin tail domain-containing protein [Flavobacteriales bacterium]
MKQILFFVASLFSFSLIAQDCSEIFISEYVEGSSNNKAIEIYNPTSSAVDLGAYKVVRYANGNGNIDGSGGSDEMTLSGSLSPYSTWIITNSDTNSTNEFGYIEIELYNMADQLAPEYPSPLYMNGNDAIGLIKNGVLVDLIGKISEDPGDAWTDDVTAGFTDANGGAWWTKNHTLVRKRTVKKGVGSNPILFDPTAEWDSLPNNTWTELGSHDCDCESTPSSIQDNDLTSFIIYPNPAKIGQSLTLKATKGIKELFLINVLGQQMKVEFINSGENTIFNTSNLSKGLYNISMVFDDYSVRTSAIIIK